MRPKRRWTLLPWLVLLTVALIRWAYEAPPEARKSLGSAAMGKLVGQFGGVRITFRPNRPWTRRHWVWGLRRLRVWTPLIMHRCPLEVEYDLCRRADELDACARRWLMLLGPDARERILRDEVAPAVAERRRDYTCPMPGPGHAASAGPPN